MVQIVIPAPRAPFTEQEKLTRPTLKKLKGREVKTIGGALLVRVELM